MLAFCYLGFSAFCVLRFAFCVLRQLIEKNNSDLSFFTMAIVHKKSLEYVQLSVIRITRRFIQPTEY
ncbi:hypothetical protein GMES_2988 [Paraglaciecola mesophila KMM 241]|uniref:Uncharacterized protein n=1 Tax=Paraglaciecola mesophila KMM 241 TaxID=1128912 RepID=K6Z8G9_9ALTE|nr:hypothetical protein GMES_2988 [Paraglaciecola mesophila KMM 241]